MIIRGLFLLLIMLPVTVSATESLAQAARGQVGKTVRYDPTYYTLNYPNGDLPVELGVCTDVVIRALRSSHNMDLQKLVHEDMQKNFTQYPKRWGLKSTDKNIDHRRVLNLQTYFKRKGYELPVSHNPDDYQAGDLVTVTLPANLPHIMVVSEKNDLITKTPLVIHNIGAGTQEENRLFEFPMTGHYRIPLPKN
jgi:uncharacterized protein YijF (DUF1287 family)